jgi:ribonuclease BN (tRNA processing enzyme)
VDLVVLGSGTSVPSLRRGSSGYLVRSGRTLVLLDSGPGTLVRILRAGATLEEVSHVVYSHTHVDHTADLAPLLFTSRNPSAPRRSPLTIAGSAGFLEFFGGLSRLYGRWIEATTFPLSLVEIAEGPAARFGDLEIEGCSVPHIPSSVAVKLTEPGGRSLVYSGDTAESDALAEFAKGTGLLLIEASSPDEEPLPGHLTPSLAGRIASRARPERTVLTHFYPSCERVDMLGQFRRAWDGEAALAEDQMRITL